MATKPKKVITNISVDVLNAIRNSASVNYQSKVPIATNDADIIKTIGAVIMDNPALRNEFLDTLVQRIALVTITSKTYENPWRVFKKGILEVGETIEEVYNGLVKVFEYDVERSETELYNRVKPDVKTAFHTVNYKKFYKLTWEDMTLRGAFTSLDSLDSFFRRTIEQIYTSANYDEFLTMKYLLGREALDGLLTSVSVPTVNSSNAPDVVTVLKTISNELTFMKTKYNLARVRTHTPKNDQYVLINTAFDALADVNVLAAAFNMDKAEFAGHKILLDSWHDFDMDRLDELMREQTGYKAFTQEELDLLDTIPCFVVDKDFFLIYDRLVTMRDAENGQGLYRNYFYHTWKYISRSPFANALMYVPGNVSVDGVAITPDSVTVSLANVKDGDIVASFSASVTGSPFVPKMVDWEIDGYASDIIDVDASGNVAVYDTSGIASGASVNVIAKSVVDSSIAATATVNFTA